LHQLPWIWAAVIVIAVAGCAGFGPRTIPPDRFNYNQAIAESAKSQMLLNLVRLRYLDVPVFLKVSSVVAQYTYEGDAGINAVRGFQSAPNILGLEANLGYAERPTISYLPLADREFTKRMLSTFSPDAIFSFAEAGWPVDLILKAGVERINDVRNLSFAAVPPPGELDLRRQIDKNLRDARVYHRVVRLMLTLSARGALRARVSSDEAAETRTIVFQATDETETNALIAELKERLGLDPTRNEYRFANRIASRKPNEIAVQTRSLLAMMQYLSKGVDVPTIHSDESNVVEYFKGADADTRRSLVPITIRSSAEPPKRAHVAIKYEDFWYYIERTDFLSKRSFALLVFLLHMQSDDGSTTGPILTLPAGG
jgi:hypothetical protein